jgi:hypothetical protein
MTRSRARTLSGPTNATVNHKASYISNGNQIFSVDTDVEVDHAWESFNDEVIEDFHRRRNAGEVIISPCYHVKESSRTIGSGSEDYDYKGVHHKIVGHGLTMWHYAAQASYMGGDLPVPSPSYDLAASSKLSALGNLDRTPYSFAEDIAELRQTLRFLKDPLGNLKRLSKEFKRDVRALKNRWARKKLADALANLWLEYQFAFSPLLRSAHDAFEAYSDAVQRPERRTANGSAHFEFSDSDPQRHIGSWISEHTVKSTTDVHAGIVYEVSNPLNDWKYKYGLRFKDIPETLWAVMPYSFMVDRVWNFSQAARGFASFLDPNVKILGAWQSEKTTTVRTASWLRHEHPQALNQVIHPDVWHRESEIYTRDVWEPTFSDLIPKGNYSGLIDTSTKIADLAALIYSNIRR